MRRTDSKAFGALVTQNRADIYLINDKNERIPFFIDGEFYADPADAVVLGRGQQGKVYAAIIVKTSTNGTEESRLCVLKEMNGTKTNTTAFSQHSAITETHNSSTENNIIKLMAVLQNEDECYALLPFCGLFLDKIIDTLPTLTASQLTLKEAIILHALMDLLSALQSMHTNGFVHGDVKGANAAYYLGHFCLIDLDCALRINEPVKQISGSPCFMHPACFSDRNFCARPENDIYALGVVLKQLLQDETTASWLASKKPLIDISKEQSEKWANACKNCRTTTTPPDLQTDINARRSIRAKLLEIANRMTDIRLYDQDKSYQPSIAELLSCCSNIKHALIEKHSELGSIEEQEQELRALYNGFIPREFLSRLQDVETPLVSRHVSMASFFGGHPPMPSSAAGLSSSSLLNYRHGGNEE